MFSGLELKFHGSHYFSFPLKDDLESPAAVQVPGPSSQDLEDGEIPDDSVQILEVDRLV